MLQIKPVTAENKEQDIIRELFADYQKELGEDLGFQGFDVELQDPLRKYGADGGALLLAYWNDAVAGCIALQDLGNGECEMKRMFVKPAFRKYGIGKALAVHLINAAKQLGYSVMKLDTLRKLQPAIHLYKQLGFVETIAYYRNPISDVIFMELDL